MNSHPTFKTNSYLTNVIK